MGDIGVRDRSGESEQRTADAPNLSLRTRTAGLANHHGCPHHGALAEYVDTGVSSSQETGYSPRGREA